MDGIPIDKKPCTKFLGMFVDRQLNWHEHIQYIQNKLSSSLYILNKVKHILPQKYLLTLYYSLIYPYLTYGLTLWGGTHKTYTNKILVLQKKLVRAIHKAIYNDHTNSLFMNIGILKLPELYSWYIANFMYRYTNGMLPRSLDNIFITHQSVHNYSTRNQSNMSVPLHRSSAAYNSQFHVGPITWNKLQNDLKNITTLSSFKRKLKSNLIATYSK